MSTLLLSAQQLLSSHGIDPALADDLVAIVEGCFPHVPEPGDLICLEGAPSNDLYFLLEGKVQVRMRDYLGIEQDLAQLSAPTMFGHMGLIDGSPRSATCVAMAGTRMKVLDRDHYEALVDDIGPRGDMFRRLLLSAMTRQLSAGNAALRRILAEPSTDPSDGQELGRISRTFEGWEQSS